MHLAMWTSSPAKSGTNPRGLYPNSGNAQAATDVVPGVAVGIGCTPMADFPAGVVTEIYAKHRNSTQPESQEVCAVLGAVLEVVQAEGLQPSPTALFAALMSSLEKPETKASIQA